MDGMTNETTCSRKKPRVHECPSKTDSTAVATVSPFQGKNYTNLISETTSKVLFATDEWFARAENLIKDSPPVFDPDLYCSQGKVMDGWESRRRRTEGHDWCVIATDGRTKGCINDIIGVEVDTAFFTGNQTPRISIQVANCYSDNDMEEEEWMYSWMPGAVKRLINGGGVQGTGQSPTQIQNANKACEKFEWKEILPMTPLKPGYEESRMHYFMLDDRTRELVKGFTHVRINYFPDGGVARMRLWGHLHSRIHSDTVTDVVLSDTTTSDSSVEGLTDEENIVPSSVPYHHPQLSLSTNGGVGLVCSNKHYGVPQNLIRPTYGKDMSDGWETARHPDRPPVLIRNPVTNLIDNPLSDWAVLKLGMGGAVEKEGISRIIIDTKHFKGNFPESVMIEGCNCNANGKQASDDDVCSATPDKANQNESTIEWFPLVPRTKMGADREHVFDKEKEQLQNSNRAVTHIRVSIYPDGGISRVRVYGQPAIN
jgi:allantoicase